MLMGRAFVGLPEQYENISPAPRAPCRRSCRFSFITLPCGQFTSHKTIRQLAEPLHLPLASAPDQGDSLIMQVHLKGVNHFCSEK